MPPNSKRQVPATPRQTTLPHRSQPPAGARHVTRPQQARRSRTLPWHRDGTSHVVFVRTKQVAVYRSPHAKRALLLLKKRDKVGTQRAFLVRGTRGKWVHVYLPTRPNGSLGWVRDARGQDVRQPLPPRHPAACSPPAAVEEAAPARDISGRHRDRLDADAARALLHRRAAAAEQPGRLVRAVLVRALGALERAEDVRRRRRARRPARDERAGADRLERQPRLHPAAQRGGAAAGADSAAGTPVYVRR